MWENDYPLRKRDSEPVNFTLSSKHAAVVKWTRRLTRKQFRAAAWDESWLCALDFFVLTLDFCFDYSLYIVQEVKTTATPVWVQWAHRHYRLHLILDRLVRLRNCSQSWHFFRDNLLFSNRIDALLRIQNCNISSLLGVAYGVIRVSLRNFRN